VGPIVTCDCIAQEKREGTLGLLFLAPISERAIVLSKMAVNALRAFTLLFAVLPMMALPVVFGGLVGSKLFWALCMQITALCIALAAGMLSSTQYRTFIQAAVFAEIYSAGFVFLCVFFMRLSPLVGCVAGLMIALMVVEQCSSTLKQKWEEESSDYREPFWVELFSQSGTARAIFRWDTRRARSRNPIAWLQEYSWSARLAKWGWLALACFGELFLIASTLFERRGSYQPQAILAGIVLFGICLAGANSFRQERLSGAMELLLVTPLSPLQIMFGRLWGLWVHFLPAVAVIALIWFAGGRYLWMAPEAGYVLVSSLLFIPMIGLYVSLFPWNILVDAAIVFITGVALPVYAGAMLNSLAMMIAVQATGGVVAFVLLFRKLKYRTFVLH
jgi:ABC-type transport system involved in multi-copper enzyme maturation permease subunit